jgi:uncharacterized membrane protein
MAIRMPITWAWDHLRQSVETMGSASPEEYWPDAERQPAVPAVRRIGLADLRHALERGFEDFAANRTDVIFLCVIYPLVGLVLAWLVFGYGAPHLLFPLASGFALIGPFAAVGLNEISRLREQGREPRWIDVFGVIRAPSFGAIVVLGLLLGEIFLAWLFAAVGTYDLTLGPGFPTSPGSFINDLFTTGPGWTLIVVGIGVGFLLAAAVLTISVVAFPMLLDRDVGLTTAVQTSLCVVLVNPWTVAVWGFIVAAALVIGSLPFLLGLAIVMPVLGHATWHLYRRAVPR